jgi:hypothetical protein
MSGKKELKKGFGVDAVVWRVLRYRLSELCIQDTHVFRMSGVEERLNLQKDGNKAKPYQVKQVRNVILKYRLGE